MTITNPVVESELVHALNELGETKDAVAAKLTELNITGTHGDPSHCPVANYLSRVFQGRQVQLISVCTEDTFLHSGVDVFVADNPPAVQEFISGFDGGEYPALEEKRS